MNRLLPEGMTPAELLMAHGDRGHGIRLGTFLRIGRDAQGPKIEAVAEDDSSYTMIAKDHQHDLCTAVFDLPPLRMLANHNLADRWRDLAHAMAETRRHFVNYPTGPDSGFSSSTDSEDWRFSRARVWGPKGMWMGFVRKPTTVIPMGTSGRTPHLTVKYKSLSTSGQLLCLWAILRQRGIDLIKLIPTARLRHFKSLRRFVASDAIPHNWRPADDVLLARAAEELLTFVEFIASPDKTRTSKEPRAKKRYRASTSRKSSIVRDLLREDAEPFQGTKADLAREAKYTSQASLDRIKGFASLWARNQERIQEQRRARASRMASKRNA